MFDHMSRGTAAPAQPPPPQKVLRFDKGYLKSLPGILKIVALVCNVVGFICIKISWAWLSAIFYNILYWCGNIITGFLLLMYTFHFVEKYDRLPWLKCEFAYCGVMCLAYIGTSIFATTLGESTGYAVGFFGLCAIIAYGVDCFLKYKAWKRGLPPQ
ncbi:plasmolipin [Maniola jurtina]|uniref:plasmolipin n=1 Tax=Maniola jurtina TaxID=191418 RepID=UPI001E68B5FF|nr:plasmolipin [Maniola jurtina]